MKGHKCFIWSAVDVDSGEIIAVLVSRSRSLLNALIFLKRVLKSCKNRPLIVVDRGPWYPWALIQDREVVRGSEGQNEEVLQQRER